MTHVCQNVISRLNLKTKSMFKALQSYKCFVIMHLETQTAITREKISITNIFSYLSETFTFSFYDKKFKKSRASCYKMKTNNVRNSTSASYDTLYHI